MKWKGIYKSLFLPTDWVQIIIISQSLTCQIKPHQCQGSYDINHGHPISYKMSVKWLITVTWSSKMVHYKKNSITCNIGFGLKLRLQDVDTLHDIRWTSSSEVMYMMTRGSEYTGVSNNQQKISVHTWKKNSWDFWHHYKGTHYWPAIEILLVFCTGQCWISNISINTTWIPLDSRPYEIMTAYRWEYPCKDSPLEVTTRPIDIIEFTKVIIFIDRKH